MNRILIQGGRVIDPSQDLDRVTNLLLENGKVAGLDVDDRDDELIGDALVIDASDRIVSTASTRCRPVKWSNFPVASRGWR